MISAHYNLCLPGLSNFPASASLIAGTTGIHHHTWLIFVFLIETGFCHYWPGLSQTPDLRWYTHFCLPNCWDYRHKPLHLASKLFVCLFKKPSSSVAQTGVQWHDLSSLQPLLLGSSDSPAPTSQVAGIARVCHHPPLLLYFPPTPLFCPFSRDRVSPCWPGWSWTPSGRWDYRREPPCPS